MELVDSLDAVVSGVIPDKVVEVEIERVPRELAHPFPNQEPKTRRVIIKLSDFDVDLATVCDQPRVAHLVRIVVPLEFFPKFTADSQSVLQVLCPLK